MTMYFWLIVSTALAVVASEDVTSRRINATEVINTLCRIIENEVGTSPNYIVDRVLKQVKFDIIRLEKDFVELPDAVNKFEWRTTLYASADNYTDHFNSEELTYKNGFLIDLSDLERYKNATVTEQEEDIIVDASFQYSNLVFDYQYNTKYMELPPNEYLLGLIPNITFTVQIRVTLAGIVTLEEYKFNESESLSLFWKEKDSTDDSIAKTFDVVTKSFLKPILNDTLSKYVKETLEELIKQHNSEISY